MAIWKSAGTIYLLAWIIHLFSFWIVISRATGYFRAHVMRLQHIMNIQLMMVLGSFFIFRRITALFFEPAALLSSKKEAEDDGGSSGSPSRGRRFPHGKAPFKFSKEKFRWPLAIILSIFIFCTHFAYFLYYFANAAEPRFVSWFCLCCVGVWSHLVAFLIGFSILNFLVRFVSVKSTFFKTVVARYSIVQNFFTNARTQTFVALYLTVIFSLFALYAASTPYVRRVRVDLKNLPTSLDGLTIALLTDIHAGPTVGRTAVSKVVALTNELNPDIVAVVGDLVDGTLADLAPVVEPLKNLKTKYGAYFTTGNHEMYHGRVDDWLDYLRTLNVRVLRNEHVEIRASHEKIENKDKQSVPPQPYLCLAGVDDVYAEKTLVEGHKMDIRAAVNGCDASSPIILMAHNPKGAKRALEHDRRIDLILCGHTHAGQLYVMAPVMYILSPFFYGLYNHSSGTQIYVSSGVHYWGAPMKMFGLAEITFLTLRTKSHDVT